MKYLLLFLCAPFLILTSHGASPNPTTGNFLNVSARGQVNNGEQVLKVGIVIQGKVSKKVFIRGLGPAIPGLGDPARLIDPIVELYDSKNNLVASNDDWQTTIIAGLIQSSQVQTIINNLYRPNDPRESAMIVSLIPGAYTAILRGKNGVTGIALLEAYNIDLYSTSQIVNLSAKAIIQGGDKVLITGFIVGNNSKILIRAKGPSLATQGTPTGFLPDPKISVYNAQGTKIDENNNWKSTNQALIEATNLQPTNDLEPAITGTYNQGHYTAIVRSNTADTGITLLEIYSLKAVTNN